MKLFGGNMQINSFNGNIQINLLDDKNQNKPVQR